MAKPVLILLASLLIYSCTSKPEFKIKGSIENYEGYVFLRYGNISDSTLIENGEFEFTGSVDQVRRATITDKADGIYSASFFLDNEDITLKTAYKEPFIRLLEVNSEANRLMKQILGDLEVVMEDEEKLRSNELFLYMDSITHLYPNNQFIVELTSEVVTSDFVTIDQSRQLLSQIDTALLDPLELKSIIVSLDRQERINPGDQFPNFTFEGFEGETYSQNSFPDQYILIDFWATWCGPCIKGFGELQPIYEELDGKLEVIAVSIDPNKELPMKHLSQKNYPWKQAYAKGQFENPFLEQLGVVFLPFYYLISPDGEILAINPDIAEIPELVKKRSSLKEVLK